MAATRTPGRSSSSHRFPLTRHLPMARIAWSALAVALLAAAAPEAASAQRRGGGQFEGALELHPSFGLGGGSTGVGFDLRGTYWMASRHAQQVGPDFVLGWVNFPVGDDSAGVLRLMGGVRVGFPSGNVTPSLFARAGLHSFRGPRYRYGWWGWGPSFGALGAEAGGALDVHLTREVSMGGHMGLNLLSNGFSYLNLGAQVAVRF